MRVTDETLELTRAGKAKKWFKHDLDDHVGFLLGEPEYYREDEYFINTSITQSGTEPSFLTASKTDYLIDQIKLKAIKNAQQK